MAKVGLEVIPQTMKIVMVKTILINQGKKVNYRVLPNNLGVGYEEVQKIVTRCIERFERKEAKVKVGAPKPEVRAYCEFSYKAKNLGRRANNNCKSTNFSDEKR